jgi:RNA polymerase primary sigma factor
VRTDPDLAAYLRAIGGTPLLTADDERELGGRIARGDPQARDRFVRANLRLVVKIAAGYVGWGLPLQDLIEEGNLGLLRAVEAFDPSLNTRFGTYASYWIRQSIRRGLAATAHPARLPERVVRLLGRWRRARAGLRQELGRDPTEEELAGASGLSGKELGALRQALPLLRSAGPEGVEEERGLSLEGTLPDARCRGPEAGPAAEEERRRVREAVEALDGRKALVLRLRYGLGGEGPVTLKEVGRRLGLTQERIRQIEKDALADLAEKVRPDGPHVGGGGR